MTMKTASFTFEISTVLQQEGGKHFCLPTECFRGLEKLKANPEGIKLVLSMCNRTSSFAFSELPVHASINSVVRPQVLLCIQVREKTLSVAFLSHHGKLLGNVEQRME